MDRRAFLTTTTATLGVGVAGCLGTLEESSADVPSEIRSAAIEKNADTDGDYPGGTDPPRIVFADDDSTVHVEGRIIYGSSTCGAYELRRTEYNEEDGSLEVLVAAYNDAEPGEDCTADEDSSAYRVDIEFDAGIPAQVTALEQNTFEVYETTKP